ncbi:MAG: DegT/DnrJ/EryC1/StrS family aminotransferase [Spirochaetales bacterium]|uniref:DegT/DnrJ/EryC1/StrS family aminotransferase n=1 Tax=Candidatus Thalassospirochaeta sargassi TaxID=3119039 RepID=A0AAJ1MJU3_9SPIO|nr:DegT/DnrJ/EryC1/StrS family aminotransferase [Spirochaetales bacterium]
MTPVTKPYLPDRAKFIKYVNDIFDREYLTNNGPNVRELENKLQDFLGVKNVILVANGTLALQIAYKALDLRGEVITTPFSFAATTSSLVWENLKPVFSDIDENTFNLDPDKIEEKITPETSAILPVHVYGNPCEVEQIEAIAERHNLKLIYDGAHAFGVKYKGKSVLNYGNLSTLSFHATKLFHTIEGGAVITEDDDLAHRIRAMINFGLNNQGSFSNIGINAKMNEFEAAMGLCVFDDIDSILDRRKEIWQRYYKSLNDIVTFQTLPNEVTYNYSYVPILFKDEETLYKVVDKLKKLEIFPRRYFHPSLDKVAVFGENGQCENSRDISKRVLCLPTYYTIKNEEQKMTIDMVRNIDET